MFKRRRGYQLAMLFSVMSLLLTACFRDTSDVIQQQPVAREYASPTAVQEVEPTSAPPTVTEEPAATEQEADHFALTATALIARQTQSISDPQTSGAEDDQSGARATAIPLIRSTIPPGEDCVHEIRAGETLFQLSLAYGVTVDEIADASEITNPDRIAVGQHVIIPVCGATGFIPPPTSVPTATVDPETIPATTEPAELELVEADDTRSTLIEQAQASLLDNAQTDAGSEFSAQLAAESTPSQTYTVQQYDTLFEIAADFGTTVDILAAINGITDVDNLGAGDVLQIP